MLAFVIAIAAAAFIAGMIVGAGLLLAFSVGGE
jgi:hypothetical protein